MVDLPLLPPAVVALLLMGLAMPVIAADEPAIPIIGRTCAPCHARLPGGGWLDLSDRPRAPAEWRSVLWRMAETYDARLTADEAAAVLAYLSRTPQ